MSDVEFQYGNVPNRYQDVIQRMTTLYPLRGIGTTDAQVKAKVRELHEQWRARVGSLTTAGWEPSQGARAQHSILYARNCLPTFVLTNRKTRPCKNRLLCPFCYARWTREVWQAIDGNFPAPDPIEEIAEAESEAGRELRSIMPDDDVEDREHHTTVFRFHLVERHHTFYRPVVAGDNTLAHTLAGLLQDIENQRKNVVRLVDPVGAFIYTTLEPTDDCREWKIHHRQLYKMIPEQDFPQEIADNTTGSVTRFERPTRRVILSATARACRYPIKLMTGDAERTLQLLDVRRRSNFRGHARFRSFRNSRYE